MVPAPGLLDAALGPLAALNGVEGAAVVARDGLTLAAKLPAGVDRDTFGAMSATILGAISTAASEFRRKTPSDVRMDLDAWRILAREANRGTFVVAVVMAGAREDETAQLLRATAEQVRGLLEPAPRSKL